MTLAFKRLSHMMCRYAKRCI